MIAAASDAIGGKKACGRKYKVTCTGPTNKGVPHPCTGKSVVVTVVDYCPPGCRATIDLSQDAFAIVADRNAGKINIKYTQV
ncbi:EG45-like domain containing protein [Camellia sinensis]|uniref:EG45-like domain containing protein n=1 Tax=Camellia sinensis TaxID=4442 RepID=UPI0010363940|nr:EG45-like domain containing protein [Camellia sinensis]